MDLRQRMELLEKLGHYMLSEEPGWQEAKEKASRENGWFIPAFIERNTTSMARHFLDRQRLELIAEQYEIPVQPQRVHTVGIVMAGNIPLVGFHDLCCAFLSGHRQHIKLSSKDQFLCSHLVQQMIAWEPSVATKIQLTEYLKGCDAYIATGSNQSAGYFQQYFGRYPHIIRKNRTAVAVLDGSEGTEELERLADDVHLYFGLGCRNVTKVFVPEEYDFLPLLEAFRHYAFLVDHHKYKHNYDYQLALLIINKKFYMTNGSVLLYEDPSPFAPISRLHYEYYKDRGAVFESLKENKDIQCIVGKGHVAWGHSQEPGFTDYADGVDTLQFLLSL